MNSAFSCGLGSPVQHRCTATTTPRFPKNSLRSLVYQAFSLWQDIKLMVLTVKVLFEGKPLYTSDPLPGHSLVPLMEKKAEKVQEDILVENDDDIRHVNLRTLITERYKNYSIFTSVIWGTVRPAKRSSGKREPVGMLRI